MSDEPEMVADDEFDAFVRAVEPRLRRALVAAYGPVAGRDAAADALAWAFENFDRARTMRNPGGYLWRVGQTAARRNHDRAVPIGDVADRPGPDRDTSFEPELDASLDQLTPPQRAAVLLVDGWGYTLRETAAALSCSVSTVRVHHRRGLAKLRRALGVPDDA